ncbi:MAG: hypothetical protein M1827_006801 [Pycnora praestabilis]|nr:MAG: hypothetical protein M1827_006801 [Pycnora praestabilis]
MDFFRLVLRLKAVWWRLLMTQGMFFHKLASPRIIKHSFRLKIPTTISANRTGSIELVFYQPPQYGQLGRSSGSPHGSDALRGDHTNDSSSSFQGLPCVVNFHGGGFTIGSPTDDARWCSAVACAVNAIVVSVGYRRAPEYPFPVAIEDGIDAIFWLSAHAEEYGLDRNRMALSGFSSGANLCFTVPLRLREELLKRRMQDDGADGDVPDDGNRGATNEDSRMRNGNENQARNSFSVGKIVTCVAFYPSVDYTLSRSQRRASNPGGPSKSLPEFFTSLFDAAYLYPQHSISLSDPHLSPALASDTALIQHLPNDIILFTCEWDQLLVEGEAFRRRLKDLGKRVTGEMIRGVEHGWDKAPNPLETNPKAERAYREACGWLRDIFER